MKSEANSEGSAIVDRKCFSQHRLRIISKGGLSFSISKGDTIVSEMKYTTFGEIRDINGTSPTDYESKRSFDLKAIPYGNHSYTVQRKEVEFGLSYYVARWYDPEPMLNIGLREFASQILQDENLSFSSGHFVQADSLIPEPADSLIPEPGNSDARIYIADFTLAGCAGNYPIPNEMTYIVSQKYFYREYFYNYYAPLIDEYHNQ